MPASSESGYCGSELTLDGVDGPKQSVTMHVQNRSGADEIPSRAGIYVDLSREVLSFQKKTNTRRRSLGAPETFKKGAAPGM